MRVYMISVFFVFGTIVGTGCGDDDSDTPSDGSCKKGVSRCDDNTVMICEQGSWLTWTETGYWSEWVATVHPVSNPP